MNTRVFRLAAGLAISASAVTMAIADDDNEPIFNNPGDATPFIDMDYSSGLVRNDAAGPMVVYSELVSLEGAGWLRLQFADVLLSGTPGLDGSIIRVSSLKDGAVQYQHQIHVAQWNETSAYFNGDAVLVEIVAQPGTGDNNITIVGAWAGLHNGTAESICGTVDDRQLSFDDRDARYLPAGCTAWLIDDAEHCFLSAGHCVSTPGVIEFNVPLSTCGSFSCIQHPPPEDQYSVDNSSMQNSSPSLGNDYAYFGTFPNSNTSLTPFEAQQDNHILAAEAPAVSGQTIRITGYGSVSSPVDPTWYLVQKTHTGPYTERIINNPANIVIRYATDTSGGNSGSAVLNEDTGETIGIHTNAGCNTVGGNQGTAIHNSGLQSALASAVGVCGAPPEPADGPLFIASSSNGAIGSLDIDDASFGQAINTGLSYDGMAYDHNAEVFYLTGRTGPVLYRFDAVANTIATVGTITGVARVYGLAYDSNSNTLYGINQSGGQLYSINTSTAVATPIGTGSGGTVGGLAYDNTNNILYGVDDSGGASRLVRVNPANGATVVLGTLGSGISDADGLAFSSDDGLLYTVDDATDRLYAVNPALGTATLVGATSGASFSVAFGMAARPTMTVCAADLSGSADPNDPGFGVPDGNLDANDFFYYLNRFAAGDLGVADLTGSINPTDPGFGIPDGSLDANDFFYYLDLFAQGCN